MIVFDSLDDAQVAAMLQKGAVGIIPTDTIYGIVTRAGDAQAVDRLYQLKQRPDEIRSGTVIAASVQQLVDLGIDRAAIQQVAHLWPNPLSIELPVPEELSHLYQSGAHRAFRVVADPQVQAFLHKTGPLLTTSVNRSGMPPATNLAQAQAYFGDKVDLYVQGGELGNRPPSTVAVFKDDKVQVVRPGAVTINESGEIV
ncbi:MAG TPA: L-threonylcarbamoyladenylate synthase [Candidatus Saccharimonadales bacterium]|nr:L-threonylcarbamoyladenylate synthase [Candidatus Saccharimonadales bacterium]